MTANRRDIPMRLVADFADLLEGRMIVEAAVTVYGDAIVLLVDRAIATASDHADLASGWIQFSRKRSRDPYDATLLIHRGGHSRFISLPGLTFRFPRVDLLPNDDVLIVATRCRRYPDGTWDRNAVVYGSDGGVRTTMTLGDGIESVQVTMDGNIWISYFDEGIFGNDGWKIGDETIPVGATGLDLFDSLGSRLWKFSPPSGFDIIFDCYALNVANGEAWAYYYLDFPLVRITHDCQVRGWEWGVRGSHAFAVDSIRVLFTGRYSRHWTQATLAEIGDTALINPSEYLLVLPKGETERRTRIHGRGSILHAFIGTKWYQFDLRDL